MSHGKTVKKDESAGRKTMLHEGDATFKTDSGIPVKGFYRPEDNEEDGFNYASDLNDPGALSLYPRHRSGHVPGENVD